MRLPAGLVSRRQWAWLSGAILAALFALLVYRAATQSLVHDEAFTYHLYIAGPFPAIFTLYDANHHFLSTVLMRASAALFGRSELALRLPSLIAAGWYFITVFRLALLAFGEGYLLPLSVTLAAANPLVLDLLVAARGYSIALACLTYGIYCAVVYLSGGKSAGAAMVLARASIALGLSITANLTTAIPACVLTAVLLVILRFRQSSHWKQLLFPLCGIVVLFVVFTPVRHATAANFYYGAPSLAASLNDLAALSLAHNEGLGGWNRETTWKPWWRWFALLMTGAATVCGIVLSGRVWRRGHGSRAVLTEGRSTHSAGRPIDNRPQVDNLAHIACDALWLLTSWTIAGSWSVLFIAHHAIGLLYPLDRTGLYFLPLAGLTIPAISAVLRRPRAVAISRICAAFGGLIALQYAIQLNWTHFYIWQYDADTKAIVNFLAAQVRKGPARVGTSWPLDPALNYYRETRGLTWLPPLTRQGPDGVYDTYILCEPEQDRIERYQLHVVYRGAVSGTVVAQR